MSQRCEHTVGNARSSYTQICFGKKQQMRKRFFDDEDELRRFVGEFGEDLGQQRKFAALATSESFALSRDARDVASERARLAAYGSTKQRFFAAVAAFLEREHALRASARAPIGKQNTSNGRHNNGQFFDSAAAC